MGVPLAALAINTQGPSPLETATRAVQLKSLLGQQQQQAQMRPIELQQAQLALQQQQLQVQDQQAATRAMQEWDGKDLNELPQLMKKNGASFQAVTGAQAHILDMHAKAAQAIKADADAAKTQFDTENEKNQHLIAGLDNVLSLPPDQQAAALEKEKQLAISNNWLDPQHAQAITYQSPEQLLSLKKTLQGQAAFTAEQSKNAETEKAKQDAALAQMKANQLKQQEASGGAVGTGLDVQEANSWLKKHPGKDLSDYQDYIKSLPIRVQSGLLSDQAKQMAAETYAATGALPAGMRSPAMSAGILNAAAAGPGGAPNIAANKAAYGANAASFKQIQETFDNVNAFENTAGKNLDLFLKQADKVSDAGSKFLNTPLRLITRDMVGTADMAAFDAARTTALTEIAKVLNSPKGAGVLSDSARAEAEGLIGKNATLASIRSAANILKQDMANRHQAYADQIEAIKGRISGKASTTPSTTGMIFARDPQGKLHQAKAGTPLPKGWKLEQQP